MSSSPSSSSPLSGAPLSRGGSPRSSPEKEGGSMMSHRSNSNSNGFVSMSSPNISSWYEESQQKQQQLKSEPSSPGLQSSSPSDKKSRSHQQRPALWTRSRNNSRQSTSGGGGGSERGATSVWMALRFVLVGVIIGSTSTALLSVVYMSPTGENCAWNNPNNAAEELGMLHPISLPNPTEPDMESNPKKDAPKKKTETAIPISVRELTQQQQKNKQLQEQLHEQQQKNQQLQEQLQKQRQAGELAPTLVEEEEAPFVNLPPPPKLDKDESFAACLLIKDDNHWLIEWLAYHYFVMPLRRLIVVVDPESKTNPMKILERYSSRNLMNITIWQDKDFMPAKVTAKASNFDNNTGLMNHRVRQNNFYRTCIPKLRKHKRTQPWLMLVDTDEYVLPSYASGHFRNLTTQVPFTEPGSVMRLLKYQEQVVPAQRKAPCLYMPRFFFGAKESRPTLIEKDTNFTQKHGIDARNMVTQRFLYREPRSHFNGKNLISLQNLPSIKTFSSVHHVSSYCPNPTEMRGLNQNKHALLRCHHYLGSQEQYFFRDDPRGTNTTSSNSSSSTSADVNPGTHHVRDKTRYNQLNEAAYHEDHAAKAWVRGFLRYTGRETAVELLQGVGVAGIE